MAAIDNFYTDCNGKKVRVRVPSQMGGNDRRIYINRNDTGYSLGRNNNRVYRCGDERYKSLVDYIENNSFWVVVIIILNKIPYL